MKLFESPESNEATKYRKRNNIPNSTKNSDKQTSPVCIARHPRITTSDTPRLAKPFGKTQRAKANPPMLLEWENHPTARSGAAVKHRSRLFRPQIDAHLQKKTVSFREPPKSPSPPDARASTQSFQNDSPSSNLLQWQYNITNGRKNIRRPNTVSSPGVKDLHCHEISANYENSMLTRTDIFQWQNNRSERQRRRRHLTSRSTSELISNLERSLRGLPSPQQSEEPYLLWQNHPAVKSNPHPTRTPSQISSTHLSSRSGKSIYDKKSTHKCRGSRNILTVEVQSPNPKCKYTKRQYLQFNSPTRFTSRLSETVNSAAHYRKSTTSHHPTRKDGLIICVAQVPSAQQTHRLGKASRHTLLPQSQLRPTYLPREEHSSLDQGVGKHSPAQLQILQKSATSHNHLTSVSRKVTKIPKYRRLSFDHSSACSQRRTHDLISSSKSSTQVTHYKTKSVQTMETISSQCLHPQIRVSIKPRLHPTPHTLDKQHGMIEPVSTTVDKPDPGSTKMSANQDQIVSHNAKDRKVRPSTENSPTRKTIKKALIWTKRMTLPKIPR